MEDEIATALTEPSAAEPTALDTAAALVLTYSEYTGFTPEELVEGLIALHLTPPEPLRSHLERTALRESKLPGVPVGAFLVHRSRAGLCAAVGAQIVDVPVRAALLARRRRRPGCAASARRRRVGAGCGRRKRAAHRESFGATYFAGVRRCVPAFARTSWEAAAEWPRGARCFHRRRVHLRRALRRRRRLPPRPRGVRRPLHLRVRDRCRVPRDVHAEFWCPRARRRRLRRVRAGSTAVRPAHRRLPVPTLLRTRRAGGPRVPEGQDVPRARPRPCVCQPNALFENVPALATLGGNGATTARCSPRCAAATRARSPAGARHDARRL